MAGSRTDRVACRRHVRAPPALAVLHTATDNTLRPGRLARVEASTRLMEATSEAQLVNARLDLRERTRVDAL